MDFTVPTDFVDVPIGIGLDEARAEVNIRNAHPSLAVDEEHQTLSEMAQALHQVSCLLSEVGVVYAASCLRTIAGEPSQGTLAVAITDFPYGDDVTVAARGTLRGVLKSRGAGWSGTVIEIPCGTAAIFTGGQSFTLPATLSYVGEDVEVPTAQFHAVIPVAPIATADRRLMCLIAFATPNVKHWDGHYARMMAEVLRSLHFVGVTANDGIAQDDDSRVG
ncbi:hypothetical protein [Streptomyces sp. NPDC090053]|uniref:hypothetical protein n=1 Tax=Streptomyces sp. NPDC090053 TaxID=3365932 RepID=UPI00380B65FF